MPAASFLTSAANSGGFPADVGLEVAVAGRSNSGKSSAINAVLGAKGLARVGKTPGRTQLVNFFSIAEARRLVDLPGYGYAKVPAAVQARWEDLVAGYFEGRRSIAGLVVTVDIRRGIGRLDRRMIEWAVSLELPLMLLATKADKLSRGAAARQVLAMRADAPAEAAVVAFSATKRGGVAVLERQLLEWLDLPRGARLGGAAAAD